MTTSASTPTDTQSSDADRAAIAALPKRMAAVWAQHDADAFAELFTEDGAMILPGLYKKGRAEIRPYMAAAYQGAYKGTRATGWPLDIKPLGSGSVALVTEGGVIQPGERELSAKATIRASWILVKRNGQWLIALYQNCSRDPAA